MKIIHIIYNEWRPEQVKILSSYGINVEKGYDRFDIEEGELYSTIKPLLVKWKVEESFGTVYDNKDINDNNFLVYVGTWVNGYPQPEDISGYLKLTYDLTHYCNQCGVGAIQHSPFRLKREPNWGNKKLFELNWVFDEIFVRKDVYDDIFKPLGIENIPVVLYKKDTEISNTVQLKIPFVSTDYTLSLENQPFQICKKCGRKKYSPKIRGYFPGYKNPPRSSEIFKCNEFFGTELEAHNKIFITDELLRKLYSIKVKPNVWAVR